MRASANQIATALSPETTDPALADAAEIAARLLDRDITAIARCGNSGNNRLYRVATDEGVFALKSYPTIGQDPRDRLGNEFSAFTFLRRHGIADVPDALAADRDSGFAVYQWIDGILAKPQRSGDMDQVLDFVARLMPLGKEPDAAQLKPASEAVFCPQDVVTQIEGRLVRLDEVAAHHPILAEYLDNEFRPLFARTTEWAQSGYQREGLDFAEAVGPEARMLNPSDFGFHNALRRPDGKLVFIDFEYFGWDDPVKLTCDFVQHPGMDLTDSERAQMLNGMAGLRSDDATYPIRLENIYPLMGLRWCMILLNEFLRDRLARRQFAGAAQDATEAQTRQLAKARRWAAMVGTYLQERGA